MELSPPIQVNYQSTNVPYIANQWLRSLPDLFAADFETAIKYTESDLESFREELSHADLPRLREIELKSKLTATALDHASHIRLTHLSVAWSESDAYVFIIDSQRMHDLVTNFLVTTTRKQIWHNASYDFRILYHFTGKFPLNYEDSQIRLKCLINHVETYKANTGLKDIMGDAYGDWGISADNFAVSQMYEPHVLKYSATDACATFKLYSNIENHLKDI